MIDSLLDRIVKQTDYRCILTYGVLNGLDYIFSAAKSRGLKVIAIIWLSSDQAVNQASIASAIQNAKQYPETITRLSCGSELRTRYGRAIAEPIIKGCLAQLRQAGVRQPLTSIETWWAWCNEIWPCQRWELAETVDWLGVNVYPWWENKFSGIFPCTPAAQAADFPLRRLADVAAIYPNTEVVLTEFGWPAGPEGYREKNERTGQECPGAEASSKNQSQVVRETLAQLAQAGRSGVVFEAFNEGAWKLEEGPAGTFWGIIPADISGTVLLQGRTDHKGSQIFLSEAPCTSIRSTTVADTVTDAQGRFSLSPTFDQSYQCLQVVQPGYLTGQFNFPRGDLGTLTLLAGDVNRDNRIDILDLAFIAAHYDRATPAADVNGNGVVDIFDLSLTAKNYQRGGPVSNWQ
jgi:exo-beta-1,3-glucanase (GH17 family)